MNAEGAFQVGAMMSITLSADHRAIDGALAARFVSQIRRSLENPRELIDR